MDKTLMIGLGGAGCEMAAHLQKELKVRAIAIDTDKRELARCAIQEKLLLGPDACRGLVETDIRPGLRSVDKPREQLLRLLTGMKRLILVVGLGGDSGTGAAPVIARLAREKGMEVLAAVTLPFSFESAQRAYALICLRNLKDSGVEVLVYDHNEAICNGGEHAPLISVLSRSYCERSARLTTLLKGKLA